MLDFHWRKEHKFFHAILFSFGLTVGERGQWGGQHHENFLVGNDGSRNDRTGDTAGSSHSIGQLQVYGTLCCGSVDGLQSNYEHLLV